MSGHSYSVTRFGLAAILVGALSTGAAAQDLYQCYSLAAEEQSACEETARVEAVMRRHKRELYSILHSLPGAGPKGNVTTDIDDQNRDVIEITVNDEANLAAVQAKAPDEIEGVPVVVTADTSGEKATQASGRWGPVHSEPGIFLGPGVSDFTSNRQTQ